MCGITGIWSKNAMPIEVGVIERFNDALIHRGPDGGNVAILSKGKVALGHRRLKILDLSELGKQPMSYARGRYTITFNGEVFNFLELRTSLIAKGYKFESETDTEVILAAFHEWGEDCLNYFNGMWALAIYDAQTESLFLARDRFGIKPLYYSETSDRICFASEPIAFKSLDGFQRSIDDEMLSESFNMPYALEGHGRTIFKGIYQLLPGHKMVINTSGEMRVSRWYNILDKIGDWSLNYEDSVALFRSTLQDAVSIRLRSDVPVASSLSGGLDSSSVYAIVQSVFHDSQDLRRVPQDANRAVTAIFPNTPVDEFEYAKEVVDYFGSKAWDKVEIAGNELADSVASVTQQFDTIAGTAMNSISGIYEAIRNQGIVVSMDGHGVDEMMYGYRYMIRELLSFYQWRGTKAQMDGVEETLSMLYHPDDRLKAAQKLSHESQSALRKRKSIRGRFSALKRRMFVTEFINQGRNAHIQVADGNPYNFTERAFEERLLLDDFFVYNLPSFLRDFDRCSMMHGIEVRAPFMDYRLVEMLFSMPMEFKLGGGKNKRILRDAVRPILPKGIVDRTYKVGISAPMKHWLLGDLNVMAKDLLASDGTKDLQDMFAPSRLNALITRLSSGDLKAKDIKDIWFIMNYQLIQV